MFNLILIYKEEYNFWVVIWRDSWWWWPFRRCKKQQLQGILVETTPNEVKSNAGSADQQQQHDVSRTPPIFAAADATMVEAKINQTSWENLAC